MHRGGPHSSALFLLAALALASVPGAAAAAPPRLVPIHQGKLWGYGDAPGHFVIPPAYDRAEPFVDGLAWVKKAGKEGFIDATGKVVVPLVYDDLQPFSEGFAVACRETARPTGVTTGVGAGRREVGFPECTLVDRGGREVMPARYNHIGRVTRGVEQVELWVPSRCLTAVQWGLIDTSGRERIAPRFCMVGVPSDDLVEVVYSETAPWQRRFGYDDLAGHVVIPELPYDSAYETWHEGLIGVRKGGKVGFIDHAGREVIPLRFEDASHFADGVAAARLDGKWGFVDHQGRWVVPPRFDELGELENGLAWAATGGTGGFVDRGGKVVIPFAYARGGCGERLCAVQTKAGPWGWIDRADGRWVIPAMAQMAGDCSEGFCAVYKDGKWAYFGVDGKPLTPFRYTTAGPFRDGLARVSRRLPGKLPDFAAGYLDASGREWFDDTPAE